MAMIPRMIGEIVMISPIVHHYYKSEIILDKVRRWSIDGEPIKSRQRILSCTPVEKIFLAPGEVIWVLAFSQAEPDTWEEDGFGKVEL